MVTHGAVIRTGQEVSNAMSKKFRDQRPSSPSTSSRAQSIVQVDYRGLTVEEVTDLRNQFRKAGVEYAVLKNTMINLAARDLQIEGLEEHLKGPTAVAFGYEEVAAKIITEFAKKNKKISDQVRPRSREDRRRRRHGADELPRRSSSSRS